jgi:RNA polymerase sigma factor (TIGR02999 family)
MLVHETYLRLGGKLALRFPDRLHFLGYASRVMRSVIVDLVRERATQRRGGESLHVTLTDQITDSTPAAAGGGEILHVHQALEAMARVDQRMAQVVEMRYFGGMCDAEIATVLGVTERTVRRDWQHARLVLAAALQ